MSLETNCLREPNQYYLTLQCSIASVLPMTPFNYTRDQFIKAYPKFQTEEKKGLYCSFDENGNLVEVHYYEKSNVLNAYKSNRSVQILEDRIIERFGDFTREWIGAEGIIQYLDKDQTPINESWKRKSKIDQLVAEMIGAYLEWQKSGLSEIDRELHWRNEIEQREKDFAKSNFPNWPKNLTESQFRVWQSFNPTLTAEDFKKFFAILKANNTLNVLDDNQLGAELTKWARTKS